MEKSIIENKIVQLLQAMYPESDYKAIITATAIIDMLIAEKLITVNPSKINPGDSSEIEK